MAFHFAFQPIDSERSQMFQPIQVGETQPQTRSRDLSHIPGVSQGKEQWIAFVGKLSLEKGVHCLIAAAPEILARVPQARMILIGDGVARAHFVRMRDALAQGDLDAAANAMRRASESSPEHYAEWVAEYWAMLDLNAYRQQAIAADLRHRIIFTGYRNAPEVARLIKHAEVLIIPSLIKEAFPLVSVEALCSGLMFVAPYVGGLAPILDRAALELHEFGSLARVEYSPERLIPDIIDRVTDLLRYTSNAERRADLSAKCRLFAIKHFDWTNIVSQIESVYASALYARA
jgi:glycosyltransferase involved in cell wall biosynthesis